MRLEKRLDGPGLAPGGKKQDGETKDPDPLRKVTEPLCFPPKTFIVLVLPELKRRVYAEDAKAKRKRRKVGRGLGRVRAAGGGSPRSPRAGNEKARGQEWQ